MPKTMKLVYSMKKDTAYLYLDGKKVHEEFGGMDVDLVQVLAKALSLDFEYMEKS